MKLTVVYCLLALVVASQAQWRNNYDAGIKPVVGDYSAPPPAAYPPADDYPAPYQPYKPPQHYQYRPEKSRLVSRNSCSSARSRLSSFCHSTHFALQ
uniref:Uncharacterized protein n=1 Tax=Daphnia galeata TaxID=27404 RepID=A0A8J2RSS2_9CRUS|nr:unnamed protein product [Daphnia galeata]